MKKVIIGIVIVILVAFVALFLSTGGARTDVHLRNYQVSQDGKTMTITVDLASSAGYVRDMKQTNNNGDYYLTFYSTFGINSRLGAKDTFTLELDSNVDEIYFFKGESEYAPVLQKEQNTGKWYIAMTTIDNDITNGEFELREYNFLMKGKNNTSLFVKSVDSDDYDELIKTLYPNGIVDWQGQEIGIVENAEEVRKKFIDDHTKAYTVINGSMKEVELEPFYINLDELSNELYNSSFEGANEYLFYKAVVGDDVFIFPSEWGNNSFGFIAANEENSYYIYWHFGIWEINTDDLTINKITSDEYNGKSYIDIRNEMNGDNDDGMNGYLIWIDSAEISPNNEYIVYRTNRENEYSSETSIWKVDLNTGIEEKVMDANINTDIVGFASDDVIIVGSTGNTRLVNVKNLNVAEIEIPQVENMSVQSVKNGKLIYKTYKEGRSDYTTILNEINLENGEIKELDRFVGYYSTLKNIENMSFNDLISLQNDVDNGHYSWRLKPEDVVREYWHNLYGISNGAISNIEYTDLNEAIVEYTLNNQTYEVSLVQPIKKGDTGIWLVRECKLSKKDELVQLAYQKALEILDSNEIISIETSQVISYEDEKTCDIEFPINSSDYFIVVSYTRENNDADWIFEKIQKLTTNQVIK